jgi:Cytochrome c554 and c-prime
MPQIAARRWLCGGLLAIAVALAVPSGAATASPYAPARDCAACHRTIHNYWSESAHARAASTPAFLESLRAAGEGVADGSSARRACVTCHAPTAITSGDFDLQQAVTREGVSCDFCHSVADVDLDRKDRPFDLRPGNVKWGPLQYLESPAHGMAYSPLHRTSALLCAACHEQKNARGVPVLSTYSEWKEGPYPARGTLCQECHMPLVPGETVAEGMSSSRRVINLHRMEGGSALSPLRRGLDLRVESLAITSVSADVQVVVANTGVGHAAPGGMPTKALVLAVGLEDASGQLRFRQERVYRRDLLDEQGHVLVTIPDLFQKAASVGEDTRLKPKESRSERFTIPLSEGAKAIVARLEYRDSSDPKGPPKTTLVIEERRPFPGR